MVPAVSNHVQKKPSLTKMEEMTEFTEQNEVSQRILHVCDRSMLASDAGLPNQTDLQRALINSAQGSRMIASSSALRLRKNKTGVEDSENETVMGRNVQRMQQTDKSIKVKLDEDSEKSEFGERKLSTQSERQ
jgi:hypothetical protein